MRGVQITFFVLEDRKHGHLPLYEWLLQAARKHGAHGGTAVRAMAGFGRKGKLHEEHFFELGAELPVEVTFLMEEAEAASFLDYLKQEKINLFYSKIPAEFNNLI